MYRNYRSLALGIVKQAILDYMKACRGYDVENRGPRYTKYEVMRFIKSEWFSEICDIDREKLINLLKESGGKKHGRKRIS